MARAPGAGAVGRRAGRLGRSRLSGNPASLRTAALRAVDARFGEFKAALSELVGVPGVSEAGFPPEDLRRSAAATADVLARLGVENVDVLDVPGGPPCVYGDWLHAEGAPTVLVYGHHDVVPPGPIEDWTSPPFLPVVRKGRLYGRGAADDKGAFMAWVAAAASYLGGPDGAPVNLKFLIEGEEEVGSAHVGDFLRRNRSGLEADVVVLSDTASLATGVPAITWQLRGIVQVDLEVTCLERPVHSGDFGGAVPDPVRILCRILDDLRAKDGSIDVPGLYRKVARPSPAILRRVRRLPFSDAAFRRGAGMLPGTRLEREAGVSIYEQLWTRPSLTVIGIDAHPFKGSVNQILDWARARISLRTVPNMDSRETGELLVRKLTAKPPAGARVSARIVRAAPGWTTEPVGPAFEAAARALHKGYGRKPILVGAGGSIGFLKPFSETFPGVPCILTSVFDPGCAVHSANESLHLGDFRKSMRSAVHLYAELGALGRAGLRPAQKRRRS
jgi:acetylornithine deacetylase/succinyl-diaminopimelate desuccinylase-like protein